MKSIDLTRSLSALSDTEVELAEQVIRLERQNQVLKRDIARLQVYRAMAYRDPLTSLWNRRYFDERLKEEYSRSERAGSNRRFSVAIIDVNGFKEINDQYGHQVGDALLKWVSDFLISHLRTHDVACRIGGDEFALLLPDLSSSDSVPVLARLREQLHLANQGRSIPVRLSIGMASWPDISVSCEKLLEAADAAMYEDKRAQARRSNVEKAGVRQAERHRMVRVSNHTLGWLAG